MTETTTAPPIHWSAIAPGPKADGTSEVRTKPQMVALFAAMALAHSKGYAEGMFVRGGMTKESARAAIDHHLHPLIAAFTAAAAIQGWPIDQIEATTEDAGSMDEFCWEWVSAIGITQDQIDRLTADLNAPGVLTSIGEKP